MPRVDFYLIQAGRPDQRWLTVCRLAGKIHALGLPLVIRCDSRDECRRMDDLLWTFQPGSFVPHEIVDRTGDVPEAPVWITTGCPSPATDTGVLINLGADVPDGHASFARIAEVVDERDAAVRQTGRLHYRDYRDRGYPVEIHRL